MNQICVPPATLADLFAPWLDSDGQAWEHWCPDVEVAGITADSREVDTNYVFFARAGTETDGLNFVNDALDAGAVAVVTRNDLKPEQRVDYGVPTLRSDALNMRLGAVADRWFSEPSRALRVAAVTGTNGKTSVTHFVAHTLTELGHCCGVMGTLGYGLFGGPMTGLGLTTPDVVDVHRALAELRASGAEFVALEASSHALSQGRLEGVHFDTAGFTNLSQDHLDYHGDMERYGASKRRLFEWPDLSNATVNCADGFGRELAQTLNVDCRGYLLCADEADCSTRDVRREYCAVGYIVAQTAASMHLYVRTSEGDGALHTSLLGRFNAENLLAALSIVLSFGVPVKQALAGLSSVRAPQGRMERVSAPQTVASASASNVPTVIVDYAHTPDALRSVLDALTPITQGELWCVFGCGGERDQGKRVLMGAAARDGASRVVITSDNPRREAPEKIISDIVLAWVGERPHRVQVPVIEPDRTQAIHFAISHALPGDVVLIAGKGHETYQLVAGKTLELDDRVVARQALCGQMSC